MNREDCGFKFLNDSYKVKVIRDQGLNLVLLFEWLERSFQLCSLLSMEWCLGFRAHSLISL